MLNKTIVLALLMPNIIVCGDNPLAGFIMGAFQKWQHFSQQNPDLAFGIQQAASELVRDKIEGEVHNAQAKRIQQQQEIVRLQQERSRLETDEIAALNKVNAEKEQLRSQDILLNQQLDRCLNDHAGSRHNSHGFPERCNSPVRKYAAFNESATDLLIGRYKERRKSTLKTA